MKKLLPKTKYSPTGFTLVELLVVIAIIAILATVGFSLFTNAQRNARDARRREEIDAISKAIEIKKVPNTNTYVPIAGTDFANGVIPTDTTTAQYCIAGVTPTGILPGVPTVWATTNPCPASYVTVDNTTPATTVGLYRVCALLENGGTAPATFCKVNAQ